ncbi:aminotransferase DegT [Rhodohalobacter mucosus]|uniref:Aminotransferase DegT n=2 Tax=Rhodohalobacter mucosus TaxID=2079485 RepID=A0A316TU18_9BACT|nr:aminotransferase DegT [Rhodohalobacter mucosus]
MKKNTIQVTEPFLPPLEEYVEHLKSIWDRNRLTNDGPLVRELEQKLADRFEIDHVLLVSNGTIALQIAMQALELEGEIITTPFSYVATTSSIVWENCRPVFVDIDAETLNVDANKIEESITPLTTGIIATHVFGNPCDVETIEDISDRHGLKVIYDAAHCFGTTFKGTSIFARGDLSVTSFHATKIFQTVEGGAIFTNNPEMAARIELMRNFGHDGFGKFSGVGINGKNSEMHAAMGLCNLRYIDEVMEIRRNQCSYYSHVLDPVQDVGFQKIFRDSYVIPAYYPILFENEMQLLKVQNTLESAGISPRRYFYPSLNTLDYVSDAPAPVSEDIASRILCLPLYHTLTKENQDLIVAIIEKTLRSV